ncbi:hypothetical protein ACQCN2_04610 [Brevibacillus ginsengisoli]|uniref:hypothetical protein n=1 Tax=Brevibacillus ginsengisoli TaxID=363854 RepID=UPI003CEFC2A5
MNWNMWVERTFEREWKKHSSSFPGQKASKVSFHQKALVATGVITLSALVSGCGSDDASPTAYEECKWEASKGNTYNCDDDTGSFYTSRGYSRGKKTVLSSTSEYAKYKASQMSSSSSKGGIGGGGSGFFGG